MTKRSTKNALLSSVVALLLCCSMLLGTTFAWFTDSVSSANNVIVAGNLDVTLEYWDGSAWQDVEGSSEILDKNALWEPGYTEVVYLKLANAGSLALKYQLGVNIAEETKGVNQAGKEFKLSDYIYFDVIEGVDGETNAFDRAGAEAKKTEETLISEPYAKPGKLKAGDAPVYLAMIVYMPETVGNDANHNGTEIPKILLGINAFATQDTVESDSFDEKYDANTAVFTVKDANAMLAEGKDVTLVNCIEPEAVLSVPAGYQGTLTLQNVTIASVQEETPASTTYMKLSTAAAPSETDIVILGDVVVKATKEEMSAITGTALNIRGNGTLTAIGKGDHAFGIGGAATESIKIEGVTIDSVAGGHAGGVGTDTKYYKDAPEGGAAIGSGLDGATVTLKNVTVNRAIGGSKAAAIGAQYHTGVTVTIENSVILYAEGGVSAAGIGSSRVSGGASESGTTVNIINSTVTAQGGAYGAGIGSGYDTHCQARQPLCTINISDSTITANGGKYAAGVGTGYHNAALSGEIKNSTVNAASGEKWYKDTYTLAMDIGFGVTDPTREGQQIDSYLIVDGATVTCPMTNQTVNGGFTAKDESGNATDIKANVNSVIFGKTSDYPDVVNNYTPVSDKGIAIYQVPNGDKYDVYYLSENKIALPANCKSMFQDMTNMTEFDATNLDMSQVENALCMFVNCSNLTTIKGIEDWDMSNVTNMQSMFYGCNKLENIDVSKWDTSNVTNMRMVFFRCYELSNADLKGVENWDVSNVTNFYSMFKHARGLTSLDLSGWDTSKATTMSHMFANIGGLQELDLSSFDTSNVTDMSWMFYDASKLTAVYVGDGWTTEAVTTTTQPFYNNQALVGGNGTTWLDVCDMANPNRPWESSAKLEYAVIDGGENAPGLLTYKAEN